MAAKKGARKGGKKAAKKGGKKGAKRKSAKKARSCSRSSELPVLPRLRRRLGGVSSTRSVTGLGWPDVLPMRDVAAARRRRISPRGTGVPLPLADARSWRSVASVSPDVDDDSVPFSVSISS